MTSDSFSHNDYRRSFPTPSTIRKYSGRPGAPLLAEQHLEAALRELRDRIDGAERTPNDQHAVSQLVGLAWRLLTFYGLSDFDRIREVRTEDLPAVIDPSQHHLVALALEVIGWYHFGLRPYDIDRTARVFDRCLQLAPHNQRALERFAIVAATIQPEHIGGFAKFPKKQLETALGYKLQCKRKIDEILRDVFGISEAHLVGQAQETVAQIARSRPTHERRFIFTMLGYLSDFNCFSGEFFGNGTTLSLGMGAACSQLEILGFPRDIPSLITLLKSQLEHDSPRFVAGDETPLLRSILQVLQRLSQAKWRLFTNHAAHRRARQIGELIRAIEG